MSFFQYNMGIARNLASIVYKQNKHIMPDIQPDFAEYANINLQ